MAAFVGVQQKLVPGQPQKGHEGAVFTMALFLDWLNDWGSRFKGGVLDRYLVRFWPQGTPLVSMIAWVWEGKDEREIAREVEKQEKDWLSKDPEKEWEYPGVTPPVVAHLEYDCLYGKDGYAFRTDRPHLGTEITKYFLKTEDHPLYTIQSAVYRLRILFGSIEDSVIIRVNRLRQQPDWEKLGPVH